MTHPAPTEFDAAQRSALAAVARAAIAERFGGAAPGSPGPWADELGAAFVTLEWENGQLQGCIGHLRPVAPLWQSVGSNAVHAAFEDPRNLPLDRTSLGRLVVQISVLSPMSEIAFDDQAGAIASLRPGVDGAVLEWRHHRGTFLPQVWASLPAPAEFFRELKRKAGLPADFWVPDVRLYRYTVQKWSDPPTGTA